MKILHLEASSGWGGQEIRILREAESMRSRGFEIILGVMKSGELIARACKAGFTVYPLNFHKSHWPTALVQILSIIKRHHIDLVNTHSSLDAWIGGIASRIAGKPIVRTRHLSTPIKGGLNSRLLYGMLADFVVTTCAAIVPMICSKSGKCEKHCKSIPTGVDPIQIAESHDASLKIRADWKIREKDFLVGTACVLRSWKGVQDFLQAAALLRDITDLKWVIIGGGHMKEYLKLAHQLNLEGIVHFTGHLENPFPALQALDLFALLSTANEGVSQAILQAAYLEKALLATPIGGLNEVCLDGITGIQVDPFSPKQIAASVIDLKNNPSLRAEMGRNAKLLVKERFTLDHTIKAMEEVYRFMLR